MHDFQSAEHRGRPKRASVVRDVVAVLTSLAMLTGVLHATALAVEHFFLHRIVWYGLEFIWMAPAAYAGAFLILGLPCLLGAWYRPSFPWPALAAGYGVVLGVFGLLLPYPQVARVAALVMALGAGLRVYQVARRKEGARLGRLAFRATMLLVLVAASTIPGLPLVRPLLAGPAGPAATASGERPPNVLVIILDTVRAASLSLYGYPYPTTPALESLGAGGVVFDRAIAPAPWTLPSHASMFTGRSPGELATSWTVPLDDSTPVLSAAFRAAGYRTFAIAANLDYTAWDSGLARGFQRYRDYPVTLAQTISSTSYSQTPLVGGLLTLRSWADFLRYLRDPAFTTIDLSINPKHWGDRRFADDVTRTFLEWQQEDQARPFFAFLNYFDAHQGYYAPPGFRAVGDSTSGQLAYTTAIAWIDQNLEVMFDSLRARGVLENTIVLVTSDHGELFNEHALSGHANSLYRNALHVPMVIRYPARVPAGHRVARPVSLGDVAATLVDLAGLKGRTFPGATLRQAWEQPEAPRAPVIAEVGVAPGTSSAQPNATSGLISLFTDSLQYIRRLADGKEEVFNYRTDPLDVKNLAGDPGIVTPLRAVVDSILSRRGVGGEARRSGAGG